MRLTKRKLNIFLLICILIIFFESLNSLFGIRIQTQLDLKNNIALVQLDYFSSILLFIIFALYNYIFFDKIIINTLYKGVFSLLIISNILFKLFVYPKTTIFSYISIIVQLILLFCIITYNERITK